MADYRAQTSVGRKLPVGSLSARYVRLLLEHSATQLLWRRWKLSLAVVLAVELMRRKLAQRRRALAAAAAATPSAPGAAPAAAGALPALPAPATPWHEVLCGARGRLVPAPLELLGGAVCTLLGANLVVWKSRKLSVMLAVQNEMGSGFEAWRRAALQFWALMASSALLMEISKVLRVRLGLSWRRTVTGKLHDLYFKNMAYYRLLNEGEPMQDPDIRICADARTACETYADAAVSAINAAIFTLTYSGDFFVRHGLKWFLVGPAFGLVIVPRAFQALSRDIGWAFGAAQGTLSLYQQALTRTQLHGERISVLQGEGYEGKKLGALLDSAVQCQRLVWPPTRATELLELLLFKVSAPYSLTIASFSASIIGVCAMSAPGASAASGPLDGGRPTAHAAWDMGRLNQDFGAMVNALNGAGALLQVMVSLQAGDAVSYRVRQLHARLRSIEALARRNAKTGQAQRVFEDGGHLISFSGVGVRTPAGQYLLRDLSFEVRPAGPLLICGHNGAGKSSIFRCLGGLWPVASGTIARPGGEAQAEDDTGLHGEIYYLPQKPCSVIGSLSDQLTYPLRLPGGLPGAELRRWLSYVNLEYVANYNLAATADGDNRDWEEVLSLGEQQALSLARLLYHRPRFAVLDECTSAVSKDLERRFFELCRELGICCVTITHRPALLEHHSHMLRLTGTVAEDGRGWELTDLPQSSGVAPMKSLVDGPEEAHRRITAHLQQGAAAPAQPSSLLQEAHLAKSCVPAQPANRDGLDAEGLTLTGEVRKRWPSTLHRLRALLGMGFSKPGMTTATAKHLAVVSILLFVRCGLIWEAWRSVIVGGMRGALVGDRLAVLSELLANTLVVPALAVVEYTIRDRLRHLFNTWWRYIATALHDRALDGGTLWRAMHPPASEGALPPVDSPLQRVQEVKELFDNLHGLFEGTVMPISMLLYMAPTAIGGGGAVPVVCIAASYAAFRVCRVLAPDFARLTATLSGLEGEFQRWHTRLRHISEPVAFSGGGNAERQVIEPHFRKTCDFRMRILRDEFLHSLVTQVFTDYNNLPIFIQRVCSYRFARINIPQVPEGVSPDIICQCYLYDRSVQFSQLGTQSLVNFITEWSRFDGRLSRILEIVVAFDAAGAIGVLGPEVLAGCAGSADQARIEVGGLDLVAPRGQRLAERVSFDLAPGAPVLVTGPNASGKSLLGGVLTGLWPPSGAGARVSVPGVCELTGLRPPLDLLMAVPQRVYLPSGTLGDQVCYPGDYCPTPGGEGAQEAKMRRALQAAGIEYLLAREPKGWAAEHAWELLLSGGEQQRLSLARAFYRAPRFALLDECTSMIANDAEEGLYRTLVEEFGVTALTLTQRLFMRDLYRWELHLGTGTEKGWSLADLGA